MAAFDANKYAIGFDRAVREQVEVKGGKLRPYVQLASGDLFRKEGVYQLTASSGIPTAKTAAFTDSPDSSELTYTRRRTSRNAYEDGQWMDWAEASKMVFDPRSTKITAMKNKFLRLEDLILDAAMLGVAKGGANGETNTYFGGNTTAATDTANIIGVTVQGGSGSAATGFNYEKFLATLSQFGNNSVDIETLQPVIKVSWNQWKDMMKDDNFINFDFTAARPIDGSVGVVKDYMGCKFCISNILPYFNTATPAQSDDFNIDLSTDVVASGAWGDTDSSATRAAYAFVQDATLLEINPEITTKVTERADKGFDWYAYMKMELGAVRMEDEKVIAIACLES
jgi:hypothetical protein